VDTASTPPVTVPLQVTVSSRKGAIATYCTVAFLYMVALYLYVPTLPTYAQTKTSDLYTVGLVLSMYGLWQAIIRLPLGIATDWLGWRKPFIIVCLVLAGLGAWMMGSANSVQGLIAGRIITGLACGTWVPLTVVFSSLFDAKEAIRAAAILTMIGSIAKVLATAITGTINDLSGSYALAFMLAAGAAGLAALVMVPVRENRLPRRRPSAGSIWRVVSRPDVFIPTLLTTVIEYATFATVYGFMPILAKQMHANDVALSMLTSLNMAVGLGGNIVATAIVNRVGSRPLVWASVLLMTLGTAGAAVAASLPLLFIAQGFLGLGVGVGYPILMGMAIRNVGNSERATAMGLFQSLYAIGMFGGPWLSGILANVMGIQPMFGVTAFGCLLLSVVGIRKLVNGC
jgi:MFS family permease